MLTREEQRRAELQAVADARYARLVRLNTAEANEQEQAVRLELLERRRLAQESAARRQRMAEFDRKQAQRSAAVTTEAIVNGRPCRVTRRSDGVIERRFLD